MTFLLSLRDDLVKHCGVKCVEDIKHIPPTLALTLGLHQRHVSHEPFVTGILRHDVGHVQLRELWNFNMFYCSNLEQLLLVPKHFPEKIFRKVFNRRKVPLHCLELVGEATYVQTKDSSRSPPYHGSVPQGVQGQSL